MTTQATPVEALATILAAENQALRILDVGRVTGLVEAKRDALARIAEAPTDQVVGDAGLLHLRGLVAENRALLERAMAVQGRVIELVVAAARPTANAPRYGASGAMALPRQIAACALSARA
ncbi:MAG: hypothetical protein AB7O80_07855 [Acetobacteraceae bacterium]